MNPKCQARPFFLTGVVVAALSFALLPAIASGGEHLEYKRIVLSPPQMAGVIILVQRNGDSEGAPGPGNGGEGAPGPGNGGEGAPGPGNGGEGPSLGITDPGSNEGGFGTGLSSSATTMIIRSLGAGELICSEVWLEYRLDCLAQALHLTASLAQNQPGYVAAAIEMNTAARDISRVVTRNVDPAAERLRHRGRVYRAVRSETVRSAAAEVDAILTETETRLLRSAGSAGQAHYQRIAQAVGSTKRILRS